LTLAQWIQKMWSGAVIFTVGWAQGRPANALQLFALFSILAYPSMRRRIPLSRALLQTTFKAADAHKATYVIALVGSTIIACVCARLCAPTSQLLWRVLVVRAGGVLPAFLRRRRGLDCQRRQRWDGRSGARRHLLGL